MTIHTHVNSATSVDFSAPCRSPCPVCGIPSVSAESLYASTRQAVLKLVPTAQMWTPSLPVDFSCFAAVLNVPVQTVSSSIGETAILIRRIQFVLAQQAAAERRTKLDCAKTKGNEVKSCRRSRAVAAVVYKRAYHTILANALSI
jgi:hypothetical protein